MAPESPLGMRVQRLSDLKPVYQRVPISRIVRRRRRSFQRACPSSSSRFSPLNRSSAIQLPLESTLMKNRGDGGVTRLTRSPTRKFVLRSTATKGLLTLHTRRSAPGVPAPAQSWNDRREATAGSGPAGKDLSTQALTPLRLSAHPVSRILESFRSSPRWRYGATVST